MNTRYLRGAPLYDGLSYIIVFTNNGKIVDPNFHEPDIHPRIL